MQAFTVGIVGAVERSRDTLDDESYLVGLEIVNRWLTCELARARKASRRLRVVS